MPQVSQTCSLFKNILRVVDLFSRVRYRQADLFLVFYIMAVPFDSFALREVKFNLKLLAWSRIVFFGFIFIHYLFWFNSYEFFFPVAPGDLLSVTTVYWLILISSLLSTLGVFTRVSIFFVLASHLFFLDHNATAFWGWGPTAPIIIILHLFAPNDVFYKVQKKTSYFKTFIPLYLLVSYSSLIYLTTNILRISQPDWHRGEVLLYSLLDPVYSRIAHVNFFEIKKLVQVFGVIGWIIEFFGILLFFIPFRKWRMIFSWSLIFLHLTIMFLLKVQIWSPMMISLLLLSFAHLPWDRTFKKYISISFLSVIVFFGVFSYYIVEIGKNNKSPYQSGLLRVLSSSKLGGIRYNYLFKMATHRIGTSFTIYQLKENEYQALFTSNQKLYSAESAAVIYEPITEMLERISILSNEYAQVCNVMNTLFKIQTNGYLIRQTMLMHDFENGISIGHKDTIVNCSRFEVPVAKIPEVNSALEREIFASRIKNLGLQL